MCTDDAANERAMGWKAHANRVRLAFLSYLVAHWKGEISLGVSFWINGVLVNGVLRLIGLSAGRFVVSTSYLIWPIWVFRSALVFLVVIKIWQFVGTWRSARRTKGGWANAAMFCIAVVAAGASYQVFMVARTAIRVATAELSLGDNAQVAYVASAQAVVVDGPFDEGIAQRVYKAFGKHSDARALVLQSPGGFVSAGIQLKAFLESRPDVVVIADGLCASACTTAFLGAKHRLMTKEAFLGFHRASRLIDDPGAGMVVRDAEDMQKAAMRRLGASDAFISAAFAKEGDELYLPDRATLKSNGIVQGWIRDLEHMDEVDLTGTLVDGDHPSPDLLAPTDGRIRGTEVVK